MDGVIKQSTIHGEFNTPFSIISRTNRQKIKKELDLKNIINRLDLTDIYGILHLMTTNTLLKCP